jgi:transposase-like protein
MTKRHSPEDEIRFLSFLNSGADLIPAAKRAGIRKDSARNIARVAGKLPMIIKDDYTPAMRREIMGIVREGKYSFAEIAQKYSGHPCAATIGRWASEEGAGKGHQGKRLKDLSPLPSTPFQIKAKELKKDKVVTILRDRVDFLDRALSAATRENKILIERNQVLERQANEFRVREQKRTVLSSVVIHGD